ncbi:acetylxylan esterase [Planctomicrobium piriforme]|uniref:Cephalosporin-C deacetylase n=1 Tax=Planctomicrobium piriforme TaxID=1576369 RepID=A0A1I3DJM8_9PLAN|nr:acetylxylan esterase [Planctomicrobium piriforme]SFH86738.1 Cephalosporin-C deacetylase [Planctomicrobium piriforme]
MTRWLSLLVLLCGWTASLSAETKLEVTPDHASGVYQPGEPVMWTVRATADNGLPVTGELKFTVLKGGLTSLTQGVAVLHDGKAEISAERNDAGALLLNVKFVPPAPEKEITAYGGAIYAPEQIQASAALPDDFDQFWKQKIGELHDVPMNAQLERIDIGNEKVEYYHVTFDNIRGKKIRGQLAKPVGKSDLPALLQVQWAGVYPLQRAWVVGPAQNGWLALNISAHDLPIDSPQAFYDKQSANELRDYNRRGNNDREASYFLPMFLGCYRAADYLTERPDWNKKNLVVQGTSQGGYQALVTAGLHPKITGMAANVPAGCDHTGKQVGRAPGWPNWTSLVIAGSTPEQTLQTGRYFDAMNFARKITCPSLVGVGLIDTTCPPEGVIATFNQIQGPKELVIMPLADHKLKQEPYYPKFNKWQAERK